MSQPQINVTPASPYGSAAQQGATARRPPGGSPNIGAPAPPGSGFSYGNSPYPSSSPSPSAYAPTINLSGKPSNQTGGGDGNQILSKLQAYSSHVEDLIEQYSHPIKPYLAGLGRFLIVVTFYEDALRIVTQWSDQLYFLQRHRSFPWGLSHTFLISNVVVMAVCSSFIIAKKFPTPSVVGLLVVVISQGIGYGLISDVNFFLRNLSVIGGLLMVLSDSLSKRNNPKANAIFAGLPNSIGTETERRTYLQLAGRILLILLFVGFLASGEFTPIRGLVSLIGLLASLMVVIGFKAKWSAMFLVLVLSVLNIIVNNWWSVHSAHPHRDFLKYDFFQTLSIVGGLLLLVNMGPGGISVDEKKSQ
ncbi:SURF4 family-domain-containing protein [Phakopsora pachyrhizi]|nr:SURF4 family-domain-containing protein [Phakopsora pachyrhizi]